MVGYAALLRSREPLNATVEFATRSQEFRALWAAHDVRLHQTGTKYFRHPVVGLIEVTFDAMPLPTTEDRGLTMTCYSAEPGSPSEDALKLLASWTATASPSQASPGQQTVTGEHAR